MGQAVPFGLSLVGGIPGPSPWHFPINIQHSLECHMGLFKTADSTTLALLLLMKYVDTLLGWGYFAWYVRLSYSPRALAFSSHVDMGRRIGPNLACVRLTED